MPLSVISRLDALQRSVDQLSAATAKLQAGQNSQDAVLDQVRADVAAIRGDIEDDTGGATSGELQALGDRIQRTKGDVEAFDAGLRATE